MDRLFLRVGLFLIQVCCVADANFAFSVQRKFKIPNSTLEAIKNHDSHRHGRFLSAVDIPIGGDGRVFSTGLYYTKLGLGTPTRDFYVMVDTGSDAFWVNGYSCTLCPNKSSLGMDLTLYDPQKSSTSEVISCDDDFCRFAQVLPIPGCTHDLDCGYSLRYGDGSTDYGFYMKDYLSFNRINGNLHTVPTNDTLIFGCGVAGSLSFVSKPAALDGVVGFGPSRSANFSVLSQLAASGKVKRIFSHCLDSINGGGIFSIGEVVAAKFNTTPLVPNMDHYILVMKNIEVGGEVIQLPMDRFDIGNGTRTLVDLGTNMAYFPPYILDLLKTKIFAQQPGMKFRHDYGALCLHVHNKTFSFDGAFPVVRFQFEGGLSLSAFPHNYLIHMGDSWCLGFLDYIDGPAPIILGDLVLSDILVVYDLDKRTIGWTDYNCSTSIKVKDDETGSVYTVGAKHLSPEKHRSPAFTVLIGRILTFVLLLIALVLT